MVYDEFMILRTCVGVTKAVKLHIYKIIFILRLTESYDNLTKGVLSSFTYDHKTWHGFQISEIIQYCFYRLLSDEFNMLYNVCIKLII